MKINKKTLIWTAVYIGAAYGVYKLFFAKKDNTATTLPTPAVGSEKPIDVAYKQLESNVGKTAYAISDGTNIRSGAKVNNGIINNIVKTVKANESIGVITGVTKGADERIWYIVKVSGGTAYVRSDVVTVK